MTRGHLRRRSSIWSYLKFGDSPQQGSDNSQSDRASTRARSPFDHPQGKMTSRQRSRYARIVGVVVVFLILLFFFAPSDRVEQVEKFVSGTMNLSHHGSGADNTDHNPTAKGGQVALDESTGTTKCTKSSHPSKPLIQYALMIDAGSTGSRIHVYRFNNCGSTPELEDEIFKMTEPKPGGSGLSSYKSDVEGAAKSLDVLMEVAMKSVPDKLKGCSPIAVKATAGLRKLGPELSDKILAAVRFRLETEYPFPVVSKENNGVEVMDGRDEGVYAWITTNYLLGKIGGPDKSPTAAVFDLGGGSTQIVFEPTFKAAANGGMPEHMAPGEHKYELKFGGREFTLYQHSHLGYGLMEARNSIHKLIYENYASQFGEDKSWQQRPVLHPCFNPSQSKSVKVELEKDKHIELNFTGPAEASPAQCRHFAEKILLKEEACKITPCSFHGVHQPPLAKTFATEDIYIFSYFFDRIKPLGMPETFTLRELKDVTDQVCGGEQSWGSFVAVDGAIKELRDKPEYCLDLNFMLGLLHYGYDLPLDREVRIAKKLKGNEVGWCLGASLPLLSKESGWQCKIKEVTK